MMNLSKQTGPMHTLVPFTEQWSFLSKCSQLQLPVLVSVFGAFYCPQLYRIPKLVFLMTKPFLSLTECLPFLNQNKQTKTRLSSLDACILTKRKRSDLMRWIRKRTHHHSNSFDTHRFVFWFQQNLSVSFEDRDFYGSNYFKYSPDEICKLSCEQVYMTWHWYLGW